MMTISSGATRLRVARTRSSSRSGSRWSGRRSETLQIERLSLRSNRLAGWRWRRGSPASSRSQAQKPAVAFDQVVGEIAGQRHAQNRADNEARAPPQFAQYDHDAKGCTGNSQSQRRAKRQSLRRPTIAAALSGRRTRRGAELSSIRISWLYLASRSERDSEPVLIWPQLVATARSAIVVSSVSPERCENTVPQPARCAISTASSVSDSVPIWLTLTSSALATPRAMPSRRRCRSW